MKKTKFLLFIVLSLFIFSCAKNQQNEPLIKKNTQNLEMIAAYYEAYDSLSKGDTYFAAKKFLEAELLLPQSEWAPKSALMASYAYYLQNYYTEALDNLERFLIVYPKSKNIVYAHYLMAMCYYESIEGEKKDSAPIFRAKEKFSYISKNFPNTDFALDSDFKLGVINDLLASKEMYLGRHYIKKEKWIAAINRFKSVIDNYQQTIFIEEALHRLVELNFNLGLEEESQKYANLLGYNYQSSSWYEKSYVIFNKDNSNQLNNKINKDKDSVLRKFRKLFD